MKSTIAPAQTQQTNDRTPTTCYHCGEIADHQIISDDKIFCCAGCKSVYHILESNGLCEYYRLNPSSGIRLKERESSQYRYLDNATISHQILDYRDDNISKVHFELPQIHCSSCIWLLENLNRLQPGIARSRVDFLRRTIHIQFFTGEITLRKIVELLADLGYSPVIQLDKLNDVQSNSADKTLYYRLGLAGFAFGNIMLLSFPEYLGMDPSTYRDFANYFGYLNLALAIPVIGYSAQEYWQTAWRGLKQRHLDLNVPISLGIWALFIRSAYEIISQNGAGYLDSMAGLVFFLLIGKWFQQKTHHKFSFDRDYRSYFPIAATVIVEGVEQTKSLRDLAINDRISIRHGELIPADGILIKGEAWIDYSFVTGESVGVSRVSGEQLYAGGRQMGGAIEVEVTKKVKHSYLTQLWNDDAFSKEKSTSRASEIADKVAIYFTGFILTIAVATLAFWWSRDTATAWQSFTAVLIVACPCAVALSIPFIFGNVIRILGRDKFYVKNVSVIEKISQINHVLFDKTGTITETGLSKLVYHGAELSGSERIWIKSLVRNSSHPISQRIDKWLGNLPVEEVSSFSETIGSGILGTVNGRKLMIGSSNLLEPADRKKVQSPYQVHIWIDGQVKGSFTIKGIYRTGLKQVVQQLKKRYFVSVITGDNAQDQSRLEAIFGEDSALLFRQSPNQKLDHVKNLQTKNQKVMMIGDGLNDAGALKHSDVGIVISDEKNNFTPACDAILDASHFEKLPQYLALARSSKKLVYASYLFAILYNFIGLSFAVQGLLSPIIAAILMPASSLTIILFGTSSSGVIARKLIPSTSRSGQGL